MIVLFVITGSFAIWAFINYDKQKQNVDARIAVAVADARKEQADADELKFAQRDKEPNREFIGPDDFGRVTFSYPKTWSVYESSDLSQDATKYQAYLHPIVVPPVSDEQKFALRVTVQNGTPEAYIDEFKSQLEDGLLKSVPFFTNGHQGTRLDGNFDENQRGAAVVLKVRDKTLIVKTDAPVFLPDFENVIKTINFNA